MHRVWQQLEGEALDGFAADERALLQGYLTRICDNLDRVNEHSKGRKH
jgi:hypothetical protein